jgi:hypothetical protein
MIFPRAPPLDGAGEARPVVGAEALAALQAAARGPYAVTRRAQGEAMNDPLWKSWPVIFLILLLVATALADVEPWPASLLHSLGSNL